MEQYNNLFGYEDYKIKKPIRLIELFGGYGSQALALEYLHKDFEHWKLCEWNYKSCHAYRRFHMPDDKNNYAEGHSEEEIIDFLSSKGISSDWNNPMTKKQIIMMNKRERERAYSDIIATHNLVNIMQVHADDLEINDTENYDYMMFYSFPCVPKGTLILTDKGYKEVQDIVSGDIVMTHKNRLRKVVKTMKRKSENYIIVNGVGATNLILTPNHPLYIFRNNNFQWIKAQDLKNTDYLTYNIPNEERKADLSDNMLWLLGRYVADGHYNKYSSNSINFSIGFKKENEFIDHIPSQFKDRFKRFVKKGVYDYRIADKWLKDFCLFNFHTGSKIKIIPEWVIELPKDQLQSFFDGYMSGDGHKRIRNNHPQYMFSTVSQALLYSLQRIVFKLYHRITTINIRKKERFSDCYNGQFSLGNKYLHQKIVNNYLLGRIKSVKFIDKPIDVYNFEVEEDNSYTIFNVNVHNCQDLSLAGKRAGMSDTSTRSGLLWEVERILSECEEGHKPQVLIMENVIQVHSQIQMKDFQKWLSRLNELGYQNYWEDLSATDFGIPQTRVRTIMVSVLGDYTYHFPKPEKLTLRLKDMLESDVDKKYYLSERQIKAILFSDYAENKNRINAESGVIHTLRARDFKDPQCVKITDATLKGYDEAYDGDGVYTNNIKGKRGTVQHAMVQTIKTNPDVGVVILGAYTPSGRAGRLIDVNYCSPCVTTGSHGTPDCVKQIANLHPDKNRDNPNHDRLYDKDYSAPSLVANSGGNMQPLVFDDKPSSLTDEQIRMFTPEGNVKRYINDERVEQFKEGQIADISFPNGYNKGPRVHNECPAINTTTTEGSFVVKNSIGYIRKLTPRECFRLMGVHDAEFDRLDGLSNSCLYHLAGDSIVVNVLMAVFNTLF